ncbi:hypothetical protein SM0020_08226 [Sinorhizobium meliloti CCNWSX0020]|uniref:Uncharacterized protein n=1 Tax=Sinorhizobium meliloti CCNWSX0020 TaxID=1107881 RepID=H0FWT0_RHIML|nr:hypothetical protein SM0020_08226 [Sinorhizobium meliloti CCNWSX0020]PII38945.1 hypothetical protein T190_13060 [Sinorhizobium meliloti CCBAU 01290]
MIVSVLSVMRLAGWGGPPRMRALQKQAADCHIRGKLFTFTFQ